MKYSRSEASPAHASAGRRPAPAHPAQHTTQHAAPHPGPAAIPDRRPIPAPGDRPGAEAAAKAFTIGMVGTDGLIPDLVTGSKDLSDSLEILAHLGAATLSRLAGIPIECALVLSRAKRSRATAGTGTRTTTLARLEKEVGEGPLTEALTGTGIAAMNHVASDFRWGRYRPHLQDAGFDSVLGMRLSLDEGTEAALAFFSASPQAFPLHVIAEARSFTDLASRGLRLALELESASTRASDLQSALESRTSIDIACGVIMAQNRCSYNDAIAIIAKASSHRNIKLRKVAEGILANLPGGAPDTHFEH
ncbi:ANTAR domain-containing protein [Pseudarthrobacter sp. SSS035]|uniref:ANTAR domain-containing protein n=1 Tax=Pseudarthrobacter sp. SSS035 TaxID=2931399 RepID=UPI00200D2E36|nr:ANTAR domain-containing protein [Pseudarthrobacter sp. SSS035]